VSIPEAEPFGGRLVEALDARGSLCIGIDPHAALLRAWGLSDDLKGLSKFADLCIDAFADMLPVAKPQSAFFERFGSAGIAVLERTVQGLRAGGALVILDVKRGDIGSTMTAYADAYLNPASPLAVDAITVSPFLGVGSLQPAFDVAAEHGGGVFALALTSNPEGADIQHATRANGTSIAQYVMDEVGRRNDGAEPLGSFGVVVGATTGDAIKVDFSVLNGPFLVPGIGVQGGTADDVARIFGDTMAAVIPTVSREVLSSGPDVDALRGAAERRIEQFSFLRNR
jgi:orotidine-5'-phosphate decarboxylase